MKEREVLFHASVLPSRYRVSWHLCLISPRATYCEVLWGPAPREFGQRLALAGSLLMRLSSQEKREKARRMGLMLMSAACTCWDTAHGNLGAPRHPSSQHGRGRQSGPAAFSSIIVAQGLGTKSRFFAACTSAVDWIAAVGLICPLCLNLPFFFVFSQRRE